MKMQQRKIYGNRGNDLEEKLREYLGKGEKSLERGSIAEQMAYELHLDGRALNLPIRGKKRLEYKTNRVTEKAKRDGYYGITGMDWRGIEDIYLDGDSKIKRDYTDKIKWALETAFYHTCMGLLKGVIITLGGIEKASTNHLRKTRPDVASMIERGEDFSKVAKIYFQRQSP